MALKPVMFDLEEKMAKLSKCRFNLEKIRMDYSCHGRYKGIHIVFSFFSLLSCSISPGFAGLSHSIQKGISTREQFKKYCNWRKESYLTTLNKGLVTNHGEGGGLQNGRGGT